MRQVIVATLLSVLVAACTSLGPMPATTGVSAVPLGRPGVEAQAGAMPGYMLSQATVKSRGEILPQLSALIDPDRYVLPGLIAGARLWGADKDTFLEPYLGYRAQVSEHGWLAALAYGSHGGATKALATYEATRVGGELVADGMFAQPARWLGLHAQAAVSGTYVSASGTYCVDGSGLGVDCSTDPDVTNTFASANVRGTYLAATGTLAADLGRLPSGVFNDVRLGFLMTAGTMPKVRDGMQEHADLYWSAGLSLTLGIGAAR